MHDLFYLVKVRPGVYLLITKEEPDSPPPSLPLDFSALIEDKPDMLMLPYFGEDFSDMDEQIRRAGQTILL